jgi:methionine-rich copper-binding protein CopC
MAKWPRFFTVMLIAICLSVAATAHPQLDRAIPAVGSTVPTSPPEIRIFFSQALNPATSRIELATTAGNSVTTGKAVVDPTDPMQMVLKLPLLPPGQYRVHWFATGVDTHSLNGDYTFEVAGS